MPSVSTDLWYRNAIVYTLVVETFMDGNGDGIGDFAGLRRRLDYLASLGVDALWLAPFQPSPNRDDGYDVADYYGVDPRYGTRGDFVEFVHEASSRGIRVLIDLVVNHTSDRHPWFRDARARPRLAVPRLVRLGGQAAAGLGQRHGLPGRAEGRPGPTRAKAGAWYFHRFYDFQPDLNMANPRVREEIRRIIGYWLQLGVAGFRIDAVPFLIEKPRRTAAPRRPFEYLHEFREFLQWRAGDAVLLGEANVAAAATRPTTSRDGDGLHMMFNFWVNQHLFYALATGDARPLARALRATRKLPPGAQWAHFLRNHDELDLGRLAGAAPRDVRARSGPSRRCSSTAAASGAGWRRCSATARGSSSPTACCSRCPGRPCSATATRSGWATTCAARARRDPHADAVVARARTAASRAPNGSCGRSSPTARTATRASTSRRSVATRLALRGRCG